MHVLPHPAIIKFQRTDSVWRQQFLLDYFGSSGGSGKKKEGGLKLDLTIKRFEAETGLKAKVIRNEKEV